MIPKEKALELVNKFRKYTDGTDEDDRFSPAIEKENAKLCALIAVDEILKLENNNGYYFDGTNVTSVSYWLEVKQEIERL